VHCSDSVKTCSAINLIKATVAEQGCLVVSCCYGCKALFRKQYFQRWFYGIK